MYVDRVSGTRFVRAGEFTCRYSIWVQGAEIPNFLTIRSASINISIIALSTTSCKKEIHKKTWHWLEINNFVRELLTIILGKIYCFIFSDLPE